ncbi:MAG: PAS domain S-box protein [Aliarcobacter sp.]|nr:PAS domain S-box protein [Aliarcobacter sp.]
MKNLSLIVLIFFIIISSLVYNLSNANKKIDNYFELNNQIIAISRLNTQLEQFSKNHLDIEIYDEIQINIYTIQTIFSTISNNTKKDLSLKNTKFYKKILSIKTLIEKEIEIIEKLKSYNMQFNDSIKNIQVLKSKIDHHQFDRFYNIALIFNYEKNNNINDIITIRDELNNINLTNNTEEVFVSDINVIFEYFIKKESLQTEINNLDLFNEIDSLRNIFESYMEDIIKNIKNSIIIFILLLVISILLFIYYAYTVLKNKIELDKFKSALDISDNIIIVTDEKHVIKYVNHGFEKTTGYTKEEAIGKNPSMLNSGLLDKKFFDNLKSTINNGEKWNGEFINRNKFGKITYEKSSITPIRDQNNRIVEFLAIKLDITKEKEYQNILTQQSKMVSMGELLENIAHQWRQPLSIISSLSSSILLQFKYSEPSKEELNSSLEMIFETTQKLSNTIDDLRNFFDKNEEIVAFEVGTTIEKAINLFNIKLDLNEIKVEFEKDVNCILEGKESEFIQVIMNILNNSLDAFNTKNIQNKIIKINTKVEEKFLKIEINDNAGGTSSNILNKMFELYFTTKHKAIGTGMGLYMVYQIIVYHLKGSVYAKNIKLENEGKEDKGISIIIEIPLN